jgi:hypothetical protein
MSLSVHEKRSTTVPHLNRKRKKRMKKAAIPQLNQ